MSVRKKGVPGARKGRRGSSTTSMRTASDARRPSSGRRMPTPITPPCRSISWPASIPPIGGARRSPRLARYGSRPASRMDWSGRRSTIIDHLNLHIAPILGGVKLSQLTAPMVRTFGDSLRAKGRSPVMVRRAVRSLGSILADALERGLARQNVVHALRKHRTKGQKRRADRRLNGKLKIGVEIPAPDEIKALIPHLAGRWKPLFLTAIFTGLRASELRGLRWADVDLKTGEVNVRQRADRFNVIGPPKSAAGERTVPIAPNLVAILREWKLACPKGALDLVFPTGGGGIQSHSHIQQRGLHPAMIKAGLIKDGAKAKYSGLHALRHFYASWCVNRKVEWSRTAVEGRPGAYGALVDHDHR